MQRSEDNGTPHEKYKDRVRMTIGGLICVLTGSAVALVAVFEKPADIKLVVIGLVVGLIGAGIVHPSMIASYFRRGNGKNE